jgi:hypothetical protein
MMPFHPSSARNASSAIEFRGALARAGGLALRKQFVHQTPTGRKPIRNLPTRGFPRIMCVQNPLPELDGKGFHEAKT